MKNISKSLFSEKLFIESLKVKIENGLPFTFKAKGVSMRPFIKNDDIITIAPLNGDSIRIGKVVAFILPNTERLVVHRIVGIDKENYIIKGDNTLGMAALVPRENIIGIVTGIKRADKDISLSLGPEGFIIAFLSQRGFLPFIKRCLRIFPPSIKRKLIW